MSGSILAPDQIRKVNTLYPTLVAHIRSLLEADHTGVGLMKVHVMTETFDSDEMARIFRELSFISPFEKKALVRAAIYELMVKEPALFVTPVAYIMETMSRTITPTTKSQPETPTVYNPPQFNLNINKAESFHGQKSADTPPPAPVVTSTHTSIAAKRIEEGNKQMDDQAKALDKAVANLREASAPKPIEIMAAPEDANLQDAVEE